MRLITENLDMALAAVAILGLLAIGLLARSSRGHEDGKE